VEVIDRYLQAVSSWLPEGHRADIVSELSEDLRSEIDDREEELGRALDEAELAALVERRGHPMWVAEGYLPQRHLIGPAMLPAYFRTLKIAVACLFAIFLTLYLVFSGPARGAVPALSGPGIWIWLLGVWTLAYVGLFTAIFALVERRHARARATGTWNPRDPHGLPGAPDPQAAARLSQRGYAIAEVAGDAIGLWWWLGFQAPRIPELGLVVTSTWSALHWPVAAFLAASIALGLADAIRPSTSRRRLGLRLGVDAFALLLAGILLSAWPWVQVAGAGIPTEKAALLTRWLNLSALVTLLAIAAAYTVRVMRLERRVSGRDAGPDA
jgi:hypothetical protein